VEEGGPDVRGMEVPLRCLPSEELAAVERELRFGILGPLVISSDVGDVQIPGARRRSLLLRLLVSANHSVSADRLIEDLWEGGASEGARSTLQSHISFLRRQLGTDQLIHDSAGYQLKVGHGALDSHVFEAESRDGRNLVSACDFAGATNLLTAALGRWRGDALADANMALWAIPEISRLEDLQAATVEALLDALLAQGRNDEVIDRARGILREQPHREKPTGLLMVALYRSGRQAEALAAYQDLRTRLVEELGLEPTRELADLDTAIVMQKTELDWVSIDHEVTKRLNQTTEPVADSSGRDSSGRLASSSSEFAGRSEEPITENVAIVLQPQPPTRSEARVQLCGKLVIELDGCRVEDALPGRQGRILFGYLAVNRRRPVGRYELIEALWGEELPPDPESSLSTLLSKLGRILGSERLLSRSTLQLQLPEGSWVDLESALEAIHRAESARNRQDWLEAWSAARVSLHIARRPFLAGEDALWIEEVRNELAEIHLQSLEVTAQAGLAIGDTELDTAERSARTLIRNAPYRESGYRWLMELQARRGNKGQALHTYELLRRRLQEDLGASPSTSTEELYRQLLG
jgi:DNA-binding SARP family transcriptional activator